MFAHAPKPKWFAVVTSQPMKPSVRLMRNQLDEDRQLLCFHSSQCVIGVPVKKVIMHTGLIFIKKVLLFEVSRLLFHF